ncbi:hypothetical protein [Streptomyces sp. SBT349]|uniref:hypothetical protein n=1 Tax=Streptomyces sp. SBT349 TaxID=1580539 RepID=UPI00066E7463|nr:hypothetical protein [Streptomyces sp. SBT349]
MTTQIAVNDAYELVHQLRAALAERSVVLPSLGVDAMLPERPLVELGRCNLATARALIEALTVEAR